MAGRCSNRPLQIGELSPVHVARRVWHDIEEVDLLGRAAQLSFYLVLALFPALLFLTALIGLFPSKMFMPELVRYLRQILPADAISLISKFLEQIVQGSGKDIISLGFLGALWASSSGMTAVIETLNAAYHAKETRSLWKVRLVAIALTVGLAGFILSSIALVLSGESTGHWIADQLGLGWLFAQLWLVFKWPLVCTLMFIVVAVIYYVAPNVRQGWKWVMPGSVTALSLWLIVSLAFKVYAENFGTYNAVYGSITGVIVLMLWLYLSGIALLLGGELNATIAREATVVAKAKSKPRPVRRVKEAPLRQWAMGRKR